MRKGGGRHRGPRRIVHKPKGLRPETHRLDHVATDAQCHHDLFVVSDRLRIVDQQVVELREPAISTRERLVAGEATCRGSSHGWRRGDIKHLIYLPFCTGPAAPAPPLHGSIGFVLLVAFNKPLLGVLVAPGLSLGMLLGALVILVAWALTWAYVRWANTHYDTSLERLRGHR